MQSSNKHLTNWTVIAPDDDTACADVDVADNAASFDMAALEAELPADLASLAVQLQDDANYLASAYPAQQKVAVVKQPHRMSRHMGWAAALMLLATLGSAAAVGLNLWPAANQVAVNQPREVTSPTAPAVTVVVADANQPQPVNSVEAEIETPGEFTGFHDLTAPEQEALLDLLEYQHAGQASLSI